VGYFNSLFCSEVGGLFASGSLVKACFQQCAVIRLLIWVAAGGLITYIMVWCEEVICYSLWSGCLCICLPLRIGLLR
jgi:hypothetical protein